MLRYIPNNRIGIVEKWWSTRGLVKHGFIALAGEAGFQPDVQRIKARVAAEAEKAARVGIAQALAIEEQLRASGGP